MSDLGAQLLVIAAELREVAVKYAAIKLTANEEAMAWPLGFVVEEDGAVGLWCAQENCLLDCHNAQIHIDPENFTLADLMVAVVLHIDQNADRAGDQEEPRCQDQSSGCPTTSVAPKSSWVTRPRAW